MRKTSSDSEDNPTVPYREQQTAPPSGIGHSSLPNKAGKMSQDLGSPRTASLDASIVVAEVSDWQSIEGIRTAQKAGVFLAVMLSLLLLPVGPWQWFPNQVAGAALACLLWLLTLLSASIVLAAGLTILVLTLPSRPFRFEVRQYR